MGPACAFLTAVLLLHSAPAFGQISPGPLARAHQSLEGTTHCGACHKLGAGVTEFKCLECHTEIAQRIAARQGYHAIVAKGGGTSRDCIPCHSDHNGLDFALIHWEPSELGFDHSKTGYPLEGKHAGLSCRQCHNAKNIPLSERPSLRSKDLNRTFLGLSRNCGSCHADPHRGQLGKVCQKCHNLNDWKKQLNFDHAKTRYPLTGAHVRVICEKCHKPEAMDPKVVKYVGLNFAKCADCHNDPHHGAFKAACEACHTTVAWKRVSSAEVTARFDHSTTKYPLLGKHVDVVCDSCHIGGDFNKQLAYQKCADCHRPDPHRGQFAARKDGGDCAVCHTVDGFKPARFDVKEHADTAYPLQERHASVPCAKCHIPAGKETIYKVKFAQCTDCHKDVHQGQFAGPPLNNRCQTCHTLRGFKPSTFTLARHQKTRFSLSGGHVAVPCGECHEARKQPGSTAAAPYRFADRSCTECHVDPHKGEFAERMRKVREDGSVSGCEACHSTKEWSDLKRFDHSTTNFELTGTHRATPCIECHKPPNLELTMKNVVYKSASRQCEGCHQDPHAGQFAGARKRPGCVDCHNTQKWKPSLFDHETQAGFPLKGAHQSVRCGDCHKSTRIVQEKTVLFYRPTPKACEACHGPNPPREPRTPVAPTSGGSEHPPG